MTGIWVATVYIMFAGTVMASMQYFHYLSNPTRLKRLISLAVIAASLLVFDLFWPGSHGA